MRRLWFFTLFLSCFLFGLWANRVAQVREIYLSICDLTQEHFYLDNDRVRSWLSQCQANAQSYTAFVSQDRLVGDIQSLMNEMGISHFSIYDPVEDRQMWRGESIDTGIRARFVEDHLIVYRVLFGSSASDAKVRPGDEILSIEGTESLTAWEAQHRSGQYKMRRGSQEILVHLRPRQLVVDLSPRFSRLDRFTGLLEIPSFRSEFFERATWRQLSGQFKNFARLVIDVRENSGGNFVAMLRALSPFFCTPREVGTLTQPRKQLNDLTNFSDNTSDEYQIQELSRFGSLSLRTFSDYGCYTGPITVLVSAETMSVSEIFAYSLAQRSRTRVWGQPTAGDVVLAIWYDLPLLGVGYSVSIPQAIFITPDEVLLEGQGVRPAKELFYALDLALRGEDNWVIEALR